MTIKRTAKPIADASAAAWTPSAGADLYAGIDEDVPDDSDYMASTAEENAVTFSLSPLTPAPDGTLRVRYRAKSTDGVPFLVQLLDGENIVASGEDSGVPAEFVTRTLILTKAAAETITDYANLSLRVIADYPAYLLAEDGSRILLEDGGNLRTERNL